MKQSQKDPQSAYLLNKSPTTKAREDSRGSIGDEPSHLFTSSMIQHQMVNASSEHKHRLWSALKTSHVFLVTDRMLESLGACKLHCLHVSAAVVHASNVHSGIEAVTEPPGWSAAA